MAPTFQQFARTGANFQASETGPACSQVFGPFDGLFFGRFRVRCGGLFSLLAFAAPLQFELGIDGQIAADDRKRNRPPKGIGKPPAREKRAPLPREEPTFAVWPG